MATSVPHRPHDPTASQAVAALDELTRLLRRSCPWDQAQTGATIVPHTLEEAWEVADAVQAAEAALVRGEQPDLADVADELGDLLFQVTFLAMWCSEHDPAINLRRVATGIFDKLVRRHPHVFGDAAPARSADDVRGTWDAIKRTAEGRSMFDGIPRAMPALARAAKVQARVASTGLDLPSLPAALEALEAEVGELRRAVDAAVSRDVPRSGSAMPGGESTPPDDRVVAELGDMLFAAVNVARFTRVDAEVALAASTSTFRARIELAMQLADQAGTSWEALDATAQDALYELAKAQRSESTSA